MNTQIVELSERIEALIRIETFRSKDRIECRQPRAITGIKFALPVLRNGIPFVNVIYDAHNWETGIHIGLEAARAVAERKLDRERDFAQIKRDRNEPPQPETLGWI